MKSRIEILDELAKKNSGHEFVDSFELFITYCGVERTILLVRQAMEVYRLQFLNEVKKP